MVKDVSNNSYVQASAISDYKQIKQYVQQKEQQVESIDKKLSNAALGAIPTFRRISSLDNKLDANEYLSATGLVGLAFMNLPEDWRDVKAAASQVDCAIKGKAFKGAYDYKNYQHSFSFFRGTAVEKFLKKHSDKGAKWAEFLRYSDKSIARTKLGSFAEKKLGVEIVDKTSTKITNIFGDAAKASKYGGNIFQELTGRTMKRIPILSVIALAAIELPKVFGSHKKGDTTLKKADEVAKQIVKSSINVTSLLAGIGYGGAIGSKYGKAFGSLIGMGVGAVVGAEGSKRLQALIG